MGSIASRVRFAVCSGRIYVTFDLLALIARFVIFSSPMCIALARNHPSIAKVSSPKLLKLLLRVISNANDPHPTNRGHAFKICECFCGSSVELMGALIEQVRDDVMRLELKSDGYCMHRRIPIEYIG